MESRRVAPAAGTREGRRVDGEDGVRMRWEQPAGHLPSDPSLPSSAEAEEHMLTQCPSPRCGKEGAPSPNTLLRSPGSAGVVQAGLDQRYQAREGVRGSWVGERVMGECVGKK